MKQKARRINAILAVALGIIILLIAALVAMSLYVSANPGVSFTRSVNSLASDAMLQDVYVQVTAGEKSWENADKESEQIYGTQYDGVLHNNQNQDIVNWTVQFEILPGSYIDSSWNGEYIISEDGSYITVNCIDYNNVVRAHSSQTFGFIMYSTEPMDITSFYVSGSVTHTIYDYPLFWILAVALFTLIVVVITYSITLIRYRRINDRYRNAHEVIEQALGTFAKIIDVKDGYTSGHSFRVAVYARAIAARMGLSHDEQENIYYIGLLHDMGKLGVPEATLTKAGKLTDDEWAQIKRHPSIGGDILERFTSIPGVADGARYHHERYDGTGYNEGLVGENIPLCARIICVADAYDAMSSARCYRPRLSTEQIISELENGSGKQFDPKIAAVMLDILKTDSLPKEAVRPNSFGNLSSLSEVLQANVNYTGGN